MQFDRRRFMSALAAAPILAAPAAALVSGAARAADTAELLTRPLRDLDLPIIGIGTARRYADPADAAALGPLRDTIRRFAEMGGRVIDTAPSYGRAEDVIGQLVEELGVRDRLFLATKVGAGTREEGAAQIEDSFRKLRTDRIDLIAVHNLRDVDNQLAILRDLRAEGRIGALGITTSSDRQYEDFEAVMRREQLDCIQIDYALDNRGAAERILPLAQERGVAVMINLPFGRDRLFDATADLPLPDWATEIGATSWAQVFLKYTLSHPARPIAIPGMAQVRYVEDNLGAARGALPDAAMRQRMEQFIDAL
jgi:aryl-alcohol dehydrogenase-like predicted oxidoreductase